MQIHRSSQVSDEDTQESPEFPVASGGVMSQPPDTTVAAPLPEGTPPADVPPFWRYG